MRILAALIFAIVMAACSDEASFVKIEGEPKVWHVQTLSLEGPMVKEERSTFTDYRLDVDITYLADENGHSVANKDGYNDFFVVPGYFAGDGNAANTNAYEGNIWEAKLVFPRPGKWEVTTYFYFDKDANVRNYPYHGFEDHQIIIRSKKIINIDPADLDPSALDFKNKGRLQDNKSRYLQFAGTKEPWIKTGAGSPENILAYSDFDGTYDVGGPNYPALGKNQLHDFEPHLKDWNKGDPTWGDDKGKALIGLVNYYAEVGVNNQYMVTMNYEGDGWDVFPYVDPKDPYVFDVSKLAQWQIVFDYMDDKGVAKNILLTETENESYFEVMDGVEVGKDFADSRKLYYREMVARFGHNLGLVWNLGEENGVMGVGGNDPYRQPTTTAQRREFAQYIRNLDPYAHAIVSHNWPDNEEETYAALLGEEYFSGISLQAHHNYFDKVAEWTARSKAAGRPWMVMVDEPQGWAYGAQPDTEVDNHERAIEGVLWPSLMAGAGGVDWYFGWQNNAPTSDLSNEDQRSRHDLWVASAKVRRFFKDNFDLTSLSAKRLGDNIIMRGKDKAGGDIILTALRETPIIPEGEGHLPWEYTLLSLTLEQGGKIREIDPMDPK